jgi:hypothetical protein
MGLIYIREENMIGDFGGFTYCCLTIIFCLTLFLCVFYSMV